MTELPLRWDRIELKAVTAIGHHGVFDFEKRDGQPFIVDAILFTDISQAAATDDLLKTADYGAVANTITEIISGDSFDLIETLTEKIAQRLLLDFELHAVEITVHKPKAPISVPFGDVSICIYRENQHEKLPGAHTRKIS